MYWFSENRHAFTNIYMYWPNQCNYTDIIFSIFNYLICRIWIFLLRIFNIWNAELTSTWIYSKNFTRKMKLLFYKLEAQSFGSSLREFLNCEWKIIRNLKLFNFFPSEQNWISVFSQLIWFMTIFLPPKNRHIIIRLTWIIFQLVVKNRMICLARTQMNNNYSAILWEIVKLDLPYASTEKTNVMSFCIINFPASYNAELKWRDPEWFPCFL